MKCFPEYKITKIDEGTWYIHDQINAYIYVIEGEEKTIIFDTGIGAYKLRPVVEQLTKKPMIVVNSHSHQDHTGANYEFDEVYISEKDSDTLFSNLAIAAPWEIILYLSKMVYGLESPEENYVKSLADEEVRSKRPAVHTVKDGSVFDLGGRKLTVFEIPGHTPGGIFLLDEGRKRLYTGDSCCSTYGVLLHLPEACSVEEYCTALQKIWGERDKYEELYPAHHETGLDKYYIKEFIECCQGIMNGNITPSIYDENKNVLKAVCKRAIIVYRPDNIFCTDKILKTTC